MGEHLTVKDLDDFFQSKIEQLENPREPEPDCILMSWERYMLTLPYLNIGMHSVEAYFRSYREPSYYGFVHI